MLRRSSQCAAIPRASFAAGALAFGFCSPEAYAATIRVTTTIQAAVDSARPGDVIQVPAGIYREHVRVTTDNLTIRGGSRAILDGEGLAGTTGIRVAPLAPSTRLTGFTLDGLTIRNYEVTGVLVLRTDGYRLTGTNYENNREYGPFPIFSTGGVIASNRVSGSNDAAIYIGRSSDATIHDNIVTDSLAGILVENCDRISVFDNVVGGNSLGIVALIAPGAPVPASTDIRIRGNWVTGNNRPNTVTDPAEPLALLPAGVGVLVVGGERIDVERNVVTDHDTAGIALTQVPAPIVAADLRIAPLPARVRILRNVVLASGGNPDPRIAPLPGADLWWDGSGLGNCWSSNLAVSKFPSSLPACQP